MIFSVNLFNANIIGNVPSSSNPSIVLVFPILPKQWSDGWVVQGLALEIQFSALPDCSYLSFHVTVPKLPNCEVSLSIGVSV